MAIIFSQLIAQIKADTTGLESGFARAGKLLGPGGALAMPLLLTTAAVAGIGVVSLKMAGDFQKAMTTLVTGAGEPQKNIGMVSAGILQLARDTGTSTKQLADGMFMVASANFHGAEGLAVLKAAAEGARVGNADLGTTADAVTTILNDYGLKSNSAAYATNVLIATVANGKTHMEDLAGSISHVLPTAAAYHVKLTDVAGALATMTAAGVPAADAATYLRQTIIGLGSPTSAAAKALNEVGLTTQQVNDEMKVSLPDTLAMITKAVGEKFPEGSVAYNEAIKAIAGGSKQMQGMLDLTGAHLKTFQTDVGNISGAVKKGGTSIAGWSEVQSTLNFQFDRAKQVVETLMISLGEHLLPAATALFAFIADKAIPTIQNFVQWVSGSSTSATIFKVVLIALGGAIAGLLVAAFISWAAAAASAAAATIAATWPVLAIGAAIALLIVGIKLLLSHWTQIASWLGSVWNGIVKGVGDAWHGLGDIVGGVWKGIESGVKGGINAVIGFINGFIGFIDNIQIHIPAVGVGPVHTPAFDWYGVGLKKLPLLAQGGDVAPGGAAIVGDAGPEMLQVGSRGARVTPLTGGSGAAGGASGATQTIIIQLDGRVLAQTTVKHMPQAIRLATGTRAF